MKKPLLFCLFVWVILLALPWTRGQALLDWRGATVEQLSGDHLAWAPLDKPYLPEKESFAYDTGRSLPGAAEGAAKAVQVEGLSVAPQFASVVRGSSDRDVLVWGALSAPDFKVVAKNMAVIEQRFPNDAALLAWTCGAGIQGLSLTTRVPGPLSSPYTYWSVQTDKTPTYQVKVDYHLRPQWDAVAVQARKGQKMEPRNGFWWWLEAMALIGARRDEQVWAVLRTGSSKTVYDDYSTEKLLAIRRAHIKTQGIVPTSFFMRGDTESFLFYSRWREVTRQVCENIIGGRMAGRHKTALEGGRDMVMMGRLLRRSPERIPQLVGISVEYIALQSVAIPTANFKRLAPGSSASALAGHPRSLLRYANELNRKDIALQITNEWNAVAQVRRANAAKAKAAPLSASSQIPGVGDSTIALAGSSQNIGALLVQSLPIPLLGFALLSLVTVARRRREEEFVLPGWTRGLGWSAFAIVVLIAAQTLFGYLAWLALSYGMGWTTYWGFVFMLPRLVALLPLWAFAFAACVAVVGALWATVFAVRRASGEPPLGARLRGLLSSTDERTGAVNLGPVLQLIGLTGAWAAFSVALGAWFFYPQDGALEAQATDTLHDQYAGLSLVLFCVAATVTAPLFRVKGWRMGVYLRGWLETLRRFFVAHLVLATVLYVLLAVNGAYWGMHLDREWLQANTPPTTSAKP